MPVVAAQSPDIMQLPIVSPTAFLNAHSIDTTAFSISYALRELRVNAEVPSLPIAPLPVFLDEDSRNESQTKALAYQWQSPRYELELCLNSGNGWIRVDAAPLIHSDGYPRITHRLFDLLTDSIQYDLGDNAQLGIRFLDVGWGIPQPTDKIILHGSYLIKGWVYDADPVVINSNTPVTIYLINNVASAGGKLESVIIPSLDMQSPSLGSEAAWTDVFPYRNNRFACKVRKIGSGTYGWRMLDASNAVLASGDISNFAVTDITQLEGKLQIRGVYGDFGEAIAAEGWTE